MRLGIAPFSASALVRSMRPAMNVPAHYASPSRLQPIAAVYSMPFAKARRRMRRSLRPAPLADDALAARRLPPAHPQSSIRTVMSHRLSLAIAALLAVSRSLPRLALARPPVERDFKNWSVVCDNGNRCIAESHADDIDDARARLILRVTRDAGPDAQARSTSTRRRRWTCALHAWMAARSMQWRLNGVRSAASRTMTKRTRSGSVPTIRQRWPHGSPRRAMRNC